jgi:transposase
MHTLEEWMDVHALARQGFSKRKIAELTGHSRNTVRRLLRQTTPQPFQPPPRPSRLDAFKAYLTERYQACPLSAVRLLEEIRPMGYAGSIDVLRRFLAGLAHTRRAQARATVRFETPPGHQAQVDWMTVGAFPNGTGELVKVYAFAMVLGFSRMLYAAFTTTMELPALLTCHQEAFEYFGGWPRELLYDNMAQVKLPHRAEWNPLFLDFARHYGFTPRTCRVRRPRTKGKVERVIGYLQDNFLAGRTFADLADLNAQGRHWLAHTANVRLHATTQRRPVDLWPDESLTPVTGTPAYQLSQRHACKVSAEGYVHVEGSRYSLAPEEVGRAVLVEVGEQRVRVRAGDLVLADHARAPRRGSCVVDPVHAAAFWQLCQPAGGGAAAALAPPRCQLTFSQQVATTPLSLYDELATAPTPEGHR